MTAVSRGVIRIQSQPFFRSRGLGVRTQHARQPSVCRRARRRSAVCRPPVRWILGDQAEEQVHVKRCGKQLGRAFTGTATMESIQ